MIKKENMLILGNPKDNLKLLKGDYFKTSENYKMDKLNTLIKYHEEYTDDGTELSYLRYDHTNNTINHQSLSSDTAITRMKVNTDYFTPDSCKLILATDILSGDVSITIHKRYFLWNDPNSDRFELYECDNNGDTPLIINADTKSYIGDTLNQNIYKYSCVNEISKSVAMEIMKIK